MNKRLTCIVHLLLVSSLFALTACPKRPNRPSPDQTLSGMGPGSLEFGMVGSSSNNDDDLFLSSMDGDSNLQPRGEGLFSSGEQVRDLLEPIYFEFDRSTLGPAERDKAMAAADYLRSNPNDGLLLEGHCDWRGTTEYNLGLGDRRASSVRDFLNSLGIDNSRIEVLSKGDLEADQGANDQQMAQNRRAELVVLKN